MKIIVTLFMLLTTICAFSIEPKQAYDLVLKKEAVLIDVREIQELSEGMIDKAAWFPKSQMIPGSQVLKDFANYTKGKKVFVYCQGGKRAEVCKEILKKEGVDAESIGGFIQLKKILPTKSIYRRVNDSINEAALRDY